MRTNSSETSYINGVHSNMPSMLSKPLVELKRSLVAKCLRGRSLLSVVFSDLLYFLLFVSVFQELCPTVTHHFIETPIRSSVKFF